jgi:hypothetical protein
VTEEWKKKYQNQQTKPKKHGRYGIYARI